MGMRAKFAAGLIAVGLVVAAAGAASASGGTVRDGNFERPVLPENGATTYQTGDSFGPWTVTSGSVTLWTSSPLSTARRGAQFLSLSGAPDDRGGQVCERVPGLVMGAHYRVSLFAASLNQSTDSTAISSFVVRLNHATIGALDLASTVPATWRYTAWPFVVNAPHERLCIEGIPSDVVTFPLVDSIAIRPA